jgi:hypothetical protein
MINRVKPAGKLLRIMPQRGMPHDSQVMCLQVQADHGRTALHVPPQSLSWQSTSFAVTG